MPKYKGVYSDGRGGWYYKLTLGRDPSTGNRIQVTKRGFRSAGEAAEARREKEAQHTPVVPGSLTVNDLLDEYLDGIDVDELLAPKTRFDYRKNADTYVRPHLGMTSVRDLTADAILAWQRKLARDGGVKRGQGLKPNTVRLARAPLAGALNLAVERTILSASPLRDVPRPRKRREVVEHWTPDEARLFLRSQEHDRLYPLWGYAFGSGVRPGELVWMEWPNVDLPNGKAHLVDFASALGYELVRSNGKSETAVRSIDLDDELVTILRRQREMQRFEAKAGGQPEPTFVFTYPDGRTYHPQNISRMLARRAKALGLPRLTAKGWRHTCATLMLARGVPPKVAAERLGHADEMLFMKLYSHVIPTMQRDAATEIGLALFGPAEDVRTSKEIA